MKYFDTFSFDVYKKDEVAEAFEEITSFEFDSSELIVIGASDYSSELFTSLVFESAENYNCFALSGCPLFTETVLKYCKRHGANKYKFLREGGVKKGSGWRINFINTTDPLAYLWEAFLYDVDRAVVDFVPFRFLRGKYKYSDERRNSEKYESEWIEEEFVLSPAKYLEKLAEIARAHECQVVVFWPLNKRCVKRKDKRPKLSDFCFSKAVQEHADGIYAVQYKGEADEIVRHKEKRQPEFDNLFTLTSLKRLPRIESELEELEEIEQEEIMAELKEERIAKLNYDNDDLPF